MSTSEIIAQRIMGDIDNDTAMCRMTCNLVASRAMFCSCGSCLDQETITVVTVKSPLRRVVQGFCPVCWKEKGKDIIEAAQLTETPCHVETWGGFIFKQGEVE